MPARARGMHRIDRARENFRHRARMPRRGDAADSDRDGHGPIGGDQGFVANARNQPLRRE
jgi:hypothetical protein